MRLAVSLAILLGTASTAAAGGSYVSLGIGGEPAVQGEAGQAIAGERGGNGRLGLGVGFGRIGLEGSLSRFAYGSSDASAAGAHVRLGVPLSGPLGAYGRVGLERVWLDAATTAGGDHTSSGIAGAIGLDLTFELPLLGQAGVWAELSQDRFDTDMGTSGVRLWTVGMQLGL